MNILEKFIYDTVKSNPKLKAKIRNLYLAAFDFLPRKKNTSIHDIVAREGFFFGFHDVSPFSMDNSKILANRLTIPFRMPLKGEGLEVGYFEDVDNLEGFKMFGESKAWNYHKGCRLQWAGRDTVIYNDVENDSLVSRIHALDKGESKTLFCPIDTISLNGKLATTFSYERLEALMPGYGYAGYSDESYLDRNFPNETGLFVVDVDKDKKRLLLSLKELVQMGEVPEHVKKQKHFVTHTLFSPDNRYISFLHRSVDESNITKRWSRFGVYDLKTGECYIGPTDDMISHYVWNNNGQIIAFCRIKGVDSHVLFEEPSLKKYKKVAYPRLNSDGHQSFASETKFVTDTYPNKFRMANLYIVNTENDKVTQIASLYSPKKYRSKYKRHWACDLHPRMNSTGDIVCFDSVHTGNRALCVMRIH